MFTVNMSIETEEEAQLACAIAATRKFIRKPDYFLGYTLAQRFKLTHPKAADLAEEIAAGIGILRYGGAA